MRNDKLEKQSANNNDRNNRLPKGRGRCFDIGYAGGCGVECAAFQDGECGNVTDDPEAWKGWREKMIDNGDEELIQDMIEYYPVLEKI